MTFTNQCANQSFPFLSTTINDQHIQPSSIFQESKEYILSLYDFTEYLILVVDVISVVKKLASIVGNVFRGWHQEVDRYKSVVNYTKAMTGKILYAYEESLERATTIGK
ncbi:unnamed protein product [Rotaria sordida]|uniref:Uncharacterized protein n=1 Tax=Rotaria sordida TaxID=392033 RepID=A0A815C0I8_9BILA|nr:unnamed protein product [Rotaria sordida]CAF1336757.1 unnamed protein product [Rotaria sordida]CAF1556570.1 unnamed protein product [Rotaria sordida]CAF3927700.1 unnamed protein product [Rotaria sordida]